MALIGTLSLGDEERATVPVEEPPPPAHERDARSFAARLEEDSLDAEAMIGRVRALLEGQQWREALGEARTFNARVPDDAGVVTALAEALFRAGRFEEIEPLLMPWVEGEAPPPRALMILGRLRRAEGRPGDAFALANAAVAAAPDDRDILYWASGEVDRRARGIELLERYFALSEGDDPERIESAQGSLRLYRALGERTIWRTEARPERVELPLRALGGTVPGEVIGYVVKVRLGTKPKPVPLLLDSGSPGLMLIERATRKRGFEPLAETASFGGGGEGRHENRRGLFETIDIGGLRYSNVLATAVRGELDPTGRFHGLLGLSAFNGYRVTLDTRGKRLVLERGGGDTDGSPYWVVSGQLLVRAAVEPGEEGLFLLDTGATRSHVALDLAQRIDGAVLWGAPRVHGVGGTVRGTRRLSGVRVGLQDLVSPERELRAVDLSVRSAISGVEISGFVGLDMMDRAVIVVDTVARTVSATLPPAP